MKRTKLAHKTTSSNNLAALEIFVVAMVEIRGLDC